ncbi:hypothetical protein B0I37DRAFT_366033 [Chaetomium sp. MPI-CAGE-AT-0009]|nr:hypothetical protein B0I37DRAFT_366033 [Chaetomium sp. MPI-CAGE-AT-0009]
MKLEGEKSGPLPGPEPSLIGQGIAQVSRPALVTVELGTPDTSSSPSPAAEEEEKPDNPRLPSMPVEQGKETDMSAPVYVVLDLGTPDPSSPPSTPVEPVKTLELTEAPSATVNEEEPQEPSSSPPVMLEQEMTQEKTLEASEPVYVVLDLGTPDPSSSPSAAVEPGNTLEPLDAASTIAMGEETQEPSSSPPMTLEVEKKPEVSYVVLGLGTPDLSSSPPATVDRVKTPAAAPSTTLEQDLTPEDSMAPFLTETTTETSSSSPSSSEWEP